jgi:beta-1,4-mannosyl-glycoprotein beta-1,4-N-acetylglucosaminyltransferase
VRIYDCFTFNNEFDILDLRLKTLSNVVDKFVISEAELTHSGKPKPLFFYENRQQWDWIKDKIIHVPLTAKSLAIPDGDWWAWPQHTEHWYREIQQRVRLEEGLKEAAPDDVILVSDADEIPPPHILGDRKLLEQLLSSNKLVTFNQQFYVYYLNLSAGPWKGTRLFRKSLLQEKNTQLIRMDDSGLVVDGGWHFSWQGGAQKIRAKLEDFAHQELNNDAVKATIEDGMKNSRYFLDPNLQFHLIGKDGDFPDIIKNCWGYYLAKGQIFQDSESGENK